MEEHSITAMVIELLKHGGEVRFNGEQDGSDEAYRCELVTGDTLDDEGYYDELICSGVGATPYAACRVCLSRFGIIPKVRLTED